MYQASKHQLLHRDDAGLDLTSIYTSSKKSLSSERAKKNENAQDEN